MYELIFDLHSQLLKALAHSRRLEILNLLRDQTLNVSDIYEMLDLPQANISQHLMILREAGILETKKEGKHIYYFITNKDIMKSVDLLREVVLHQHKELGSETEATLQMNQLVPLVRDPVCQMRVAPKMAAAHTEYKKKTYYFCASGCLKKFTEKPEKYARS